MVYTNNKQLEELISGAIVSIEKGESIDYVTQMIKQSPTHILKADYTHKEDRYKPGNKLVTYNGMTIEGEPIQETWGGGIAEIKSDSVILTNNTPLTYPEGHQLEGTPVKGTYYLDEDNNAKFKVDQEKGTEILRNEYVSDVNFVLGSYNVQADTNWKIGFKMAPSHVIAIPTNLENITITTSKGTDIHLNGGDYVIIDMKKGKVDSVHGITSDWLANTYVGLEEYKKTVK
ncbi:MAG: hypothetical protein ACP5N1_05025 [Candidatus Woesearchaeota archaeon]